MPLAIAPMVARHIRHRVTPATIPAPIHAILINLDDPPRNFDVNLRRESRQARPFSNSADRDRRPHGYT